MGTLAVAAVVIRVMRAHVEVLIARLYDSARSDPLTHLANRRGFRETLDLELARARRRDGQVTVIVGDVDRFKEVNDRCGHQVGDAALQRIAQAAGARQSATIDSLARVGGGEFALVLPDTDQHGAFVIAERLRCEVRDEFRGDAVPITISFGIAGYPRDRRDGRGAAAGDRQRRCRRRKCNGCDRTMLHSPAMRGAPQLDGEGDDIAAERLLAVMLDLAETVDLRFSGTARHSETVGRYAEMMARELGLSEARTGRVRLAGLMHDIGKVGVPDSILQKPAQADRRGVRGDQAPSGTGRADARPPEPRRRARVGRRTPRAAGRARLPEGPERRGDPAGGAHPRRRRRLRGDDQRPLLPLLARPRRPPARSSSAAPARSSTRASCARSSHCSSTRPSARSSRSAAASCR